MHLEEAQELLIGSLLIDDSDWEYVSQNLRTVWLKEPYSYIFRAMRRLMSTGSIIANVTVFEILWSDKVPNSLAVTMSELKTMCDKARSGYDVKELVNMIRDENELASNVVDIRAEEVK